MSTQPPKPIRSPSYPSSSLSDAISQVRRIEASYRLSPVDREVAAKLIGYSGLSGPANHTLAALAQFGLVERAGKGEMRVTQRARAILHPDSEQEKRENLWAAAFEPSLFRDLQDRWPNMIPPEDGVMTYLNRLGFNQTAIRPATRAYLQTLRYLEEAGASESHGTAAVPGTESEASDDHEALPMGEVLSVTPVPGRVQQAVAAASAPGSLNKINLNVQGDLVHVSATLNLKGVGVLEKKLATLKLLLENDPELDDEDGEEDEAQS
jgi:hypothetical protein